MKQRLCGVAVIVALSSVAHADSGQTPKLGFVGGAGAVECKDWSIARRQNEEYRKDQNAKPSILGVSMEDWVLGYISGAAFMSNISPISPDLPTFLEDPSSKTDNEDVLARIDIYCRAHPDERLFRAAPAVALQLMQDQADRMRNRLNRYCPTAPNDPRCK